MSEPDWIKKAWEKIPPVQEPPPDAPAPLELTPEEWRPIRKWLDNHGHEAVPNQRLLVEILDCLRRIDDKLGRLLDR